MENTVPIETLQIVGKLMAASGEELKRVNESLIRSAEKVAFVDGFNIGVEVGYERHAKAIRELLYIPGPPDSYYGPEDAYKDWLDSGKALGTIR